ncbi:autotransporter serine protease [Rhodanobacter sp. C05]|uniref:autotransporter serine protease n=1 Tax=Rhodanobacter sp. C05 TaxID=1945855 RepID=UPI000984AFCC|nr:autotransporter serine protease [Rhodanobacter sp. C05]OOG39191.1 autotransporter domain-containing protein [Rhodanobacter sp. C05]
MKPHADTGVHELHCRELVLLIGVALSLGGCGGGGSSNVKPTPSAPAPPSSSSVPQPPLDAQLSITHTYVAHNQGYTGAGVIIGVVDTGIMASNPALAGRVLKELTYVDPSTNNLSIDDVVGHGTWVSEIAAGAPFGQFPGGIAPGADLVSARIIADNAGDDNGSTPPTQVTSADPLPQVSADLIANGAKVMNNSWGGITWSSTDTATTQLFDAAYSTYINSWGGLVVFAAGNDSQANPSTIAALPSLAPDLAKGWLTVVAVNSNNPTQLESYSDKCGIAMNYCLAAPGDVIVLDKDTLASTTNPTYYIVEGTSLAAPQVSGAAALVWQAYPYFTNDLVRQTLLGTADPLGGSQPNPTFGYGELDVGKAVNGPEQFNWGDVTVSFSGNSNWNNPISGAGGLIKQGTGTLNLTQPSSYAGLTQVQGGTLTAVSLASSVSISAGATLSGTQTVGGSVTNAGVLGISGSNVNVAGNYVQQGNGRLAVSLGSALNVAGTASLSGGDLYVTGTNPGYVVSSHTNVLTADGGLTGTFTALNTASNVMLTSTLNYDANDAWLDVQQVNVTAIQGASYTAASYGAAQRVQSAFGQLDSQLTQGTLTTTSKAVASGFFAGAASLQQSATLAAAQNSLSSLSGQLHAASAAMTFEAIDAGTEALSSRFDQLLDAPAPGGWTQHLGAQGSMSRSGYSDVGYDLSGIMVGADSRFGVNGVMGYAVSQTQGLGRLAESADQGYSHALEGMLYGGVVDGNWYTMGRFGIGSYRENMQRELELGNDFSRVFSDSNGHYGLAYGESGYRLTLGGTQLTPYVNLQYAQIQSDGFNEGGADGFGLMSDVQNIERWQAGVGMRAMHRWSLDGGTTLTWQTRLLWQRALAMHGEIPDASFTGLTQWAPVGGIGLSRYGGVAATSLNWSFSPTSSLQLDVEKDYDQYQDGNMAMVSYKLTF